MNDISNLTHESLPSSANLIKATLFAIVIACIILIVAILPAEYGIDPTGIGNKLGLTLLANDQGESSASTEKNIIQIDEKKKRESAELLYTSKEPFKTKSLTLTLLPNQGAEIKAIMEQGQTFIYNWQSSAEVYMDMHAEETNAAQDVFTSYWESNKIKSANGNYIAKFSGTHGWYWQNKTTEAIEINLEISGFFKDVYMP